MKKDKHDPDSANQHGLSRKHIFDAIDGSLNRLGVDYVDVFQIHRLDRTVPPEEIMRALHDVVESGKARYIGASSMCAWEFASLQHTADKNGWHKFIAMQVCCHGCCCSAPASSRLTRQIRICTIYSTERKSGR